jgi:general secretion pathway protein D
VFLAGLLIADEPSAWELYQRGRDAEKHHHISQAYIYYSQAAALDPKNKTYWQKSQALRTRASLESRVMPSASDAAASLGVEQDFDADGDADTPAAIPDATPQDLADARRNGPPQLHIEEPNKDFDLRGDSKSLFEGVAKAYGLDCVFDGDYQPTSSFRFLLKDVDYRTALRGLEAATGSFIVPISPKVFLVAKDTPQKRAEVEPRVAVAVELPLANTPQDFNIMVTAVQQSLGLEKVAFDAHSNVVVFRDIESKVLAARALFQELLRARGQVMVDIKLMEVSRNDVITYGLDLPTMFSLTPLSNWFNNLAGQTFAQNVIGILKFGGGKTAIGIGITAPSLVAQLSKSTTKIVVDTQVRSDEGLPATLHVGQRYPILTSGYFGPASFSGPGAYTPPPSFSFEDLGLTLKLTPSLHSMQDISIGIEAEYKLLTGQALSGIPIISNRSLKSTIGMKMGEWALVAGLLDAEQARSLAGIAGLTNIPYLGPLTSMHTKNTTNDQVILLIRPHLLTPPPSEYPARVYRLGSETRPVTPL